MATYAIGDVQGCLRQLNDLLEKIHFDPSVDQLWFAGDLVNRGPDSLGTLRLIKNLGDSAKVVLGNHDLHLLACSHNRDKMISKDTFYDVLMAEDANALLTWLQQQPLALAQDEFIMVHAGIHPTWDRKQALTYAREVEAALRGGQHQKFYQQMYGNEPTQLSENLSQMQRLRFITNVFTRMRYLDDDGQLDLYCKKPIESADEGLIPWFDVDNRVQHQGFILHGHWASLGGGEEINGIVSLDTGCVWGNKLSAWRLDDQKWFSVSGVD